MAEKMKKGPSEAGRKTLKCPHKQGINLNMREQKGNPRLTLLVGCLAIVILAGCVAKFGVIDQYRRLDAAQAAYASFLEGHARTWMPAFARAVAAESRHPFYRAAAAYLGALVG